MTNAPPTNGSVLNFAGIHLRLPWAAVSVIAMLGLQLLAVVIWAQNEHAQRVELSHRLDEFIRINNERYTIFAADFAARNKDQDEAIRNSQLDSQRRLGIIEDRQQRNLEIVRDINNSIRDNSSKIDALVRELVKPKPR